MPELTLRLHVGWLKARGRKCHLAIIVLGIGKKPQLRGHTEVRNCEVADLFQDGIATQLQVNLLRRVQVVDRQRRDLHDIANIEQVQPLALVEVSKENFHVDRFFNTSQFASASALPV